MWKMKKTVFYIGLYIYLPLTAAAYRTLYRSPMPRASAEFGAGKTIGNGTFSSHGSLAVFTIVDIDSDGPHRSTDGTQLRGQVWSTTRWRSDRPRPTATDFVTLDAALSRRRRDNYTRIETSTRRRDERVE